MESHGFHIAVLVMQPVNVYDSYQKFAFSGQLLYMYGLLLEGVRTICTFSVDTEWLSKLLAPLATEVGHPTPQLVPSGTYK